MDSLYKGPNLRAWQVEATQTWETHKVGIIQAVPGAGKTILAIKIICDRLDAEPNLKVLIVCPRLTLIQQWIDNITHFSHIKRSEIYEVSSNNESRAFVSVQGKLHNHKVFISTFHQIKQFFNEKSWKDFQWLLIVDEMHNTTENYKFPNAPIKFKLGLSATPKKRGKGADFNLGGIVYTYSFSQALADKIILDPVIKIVFYSVNKQLFKQLQNEKDSTVDLVESAYDDFLPDEEIAKEHEAFVKHQKRLEEKESKKFSKKASSNLNSNKLAELEGAKEVIEEPDVFTSRNTDFIGIQRILEEQFKIGSPQGAQSLVFVNRIKKADLLNQMLAEKFSEKVSLSYHSKSDKYSKKNYFNELKQQFAQGKFNVLISVGTLGEGIDFPYASHGIIASPIYNPTSFVQKVGRLLRSYKDHRKAILYYYVPSELVTRLLTDEKIEPNYFKSVIKIADANGDLYFVDRQTLTEEKGTMSELLTKGAAYERNEDIRRIKVPHDLDSIMRFFKRIYPENLKNWRRFYEDQLEEVKKPKKNISEALGESLETKEEKKQKEIDFSLLRSELAKNHSLTLGAARNLANNVSLISQLQNKCPVAKFSSFSAVKEFVRDALKLSIIVKIKYGSELEKIEKENSILSLSEQDMLKRAISAELNNFCTKQKELRKALASLSASIKVLEKYSPLASGKRPVKLKKSILTGEEEKEVILAMSRIAKIFFDLQSLFLDEVELSELAKSTSTKDNKFFLTVGKDIFLTKNIERKFSYPEDFGLSRWREEKEAPKVIIKLTPVEEFCKRLMHEMSGSDGEVHAISDWAVVKERISAQLKITPPTDVEVLKELERHKFEKEFSFEKLFFVTEAIKKKK